MNRSHYPGPSVLLLAVCVSCGGGSEVDITTITNETAHQAATKVAEEAEAITASDSLPEAVADSVKALQEKRQAAIQQALKDSRYSTISDAAMDSMRQAWLANYTRSCDPAEFKRIMEAMGTDGVLKQWTGQNVDSANAYHGRLTAAKKACEARTP